MQVNWEEVQAALSPVKDYSDLCYRLNGSFAYPFVRQSFNFTLPELIIYTQRILGGDARGRYDAYASTLTQILAALQQASVPDILTLLSQVADRELLAEFCEQHSISALEVASLLKYLLYWVIPSEKYLSGLVRPDPAVSEVIKILGGLGVRTNLQILQHGLTPLDRQELAQSSGLPVSIIFKLVNIADFSRLPWASKATIANIIGAGVSTMAQLTSADPQQLYPAFFNYGKSIGKNLKLGNEIESSYRIAQIVPPLVQGD